MNLTRVTITGADDSTSIGAMLGFQKQYPFVEWGILLSRSRMGGPRFPSRAWLMKLLEHQHGLQLCGHLCGGWVRELVGSGTNEFRMLMAPEAEMFDRVQLNFHAAPHEVNARELARALLDWDVGQYILQFDDVNNGLLTTLRTYEPDVNVVPLFDTSGGAGVEPVGWPAPIAPSCGYAGGLHPRKLEEQLGKIALATEGSPIPIWIDVETHVRSENDRLFDLNKVAQFLDVCADWVTP